MFNDIELACPIKRDTIKAVVQCYKAWGTRHQVCKPGHSNAKDCWDRGIHVCGEWYDPLTFIKWCLFEGGFAFGLSIDRTDNDKGYYPWNCYYVTDTEQNRNQRSTVLNMEKAREIRAIKDYLTQAEMARFYGVSRHVIRPVVRGTTWKELIPVPRPDWVASDEEILNIIRLYIDYNNMKDRVTKGYKGRKYYYDKRITVCDEWKDDFPTYYMWAVEHGSKHGLTLDRIDGGGNYEPGNCRYVTVTEQNQNLSTTIRPEVVKQIEVYCVEANLYNREIGEIFGVGRWTVGSIRHGKHWASSLPVTKSRSTLQPSVVTEIEIYCAEANLYNREVAEIYGVSETTVRAIRHGKHRYSS